MPFAFLGSSISSSPPFSPPRPVAESVYYLLLLLAWPAPATYCAVRCCRLLASLGFCYSSPLLELHSRSSTGSVVNARGSLWREREGGRETWSRREVGLLWTSVPVEIGGSGDLRGGVASKWVERLEREQQRQQQQQQQQALQRSSLFEVLA
ncbi:unnamed protein product [Calypogeia fissa]